MPRKRICFYCHKEVPIEADAGHLRFLAFGEFSGIHCGSRTRHLFPVDNCPGSPYTAQYIEGQPRDLRPEYLYIKEHEAKIGAAFQKLQEMAKELREKNSPTSS